MARTSRPYLSYAQIPIKIALLVLLGLPALYTSIWLLIPLKQSSTNDEDAGVSASASSTIPPISLPVYLAAWRPYYGGMCALAGYFFYWQVFAIGEEIGSFFSNCLWVSAFTLTDTTLQLLLIYYTNTLRTMYGIMNLVTMVASMVVQIAIGSIPILAIPEWRRVIRQRRERQREEVWTRQEHPLMQMQTSSTPVANSTVLLQPVPTHRVKVADLKVELSVGVEWSAADNATDDSTAVVGATTAPTTAPTTAIPPDFYSPCSRLPSNSRMRYLRLYRLLVGNTLGSMLILTNLWCQFFTWLLFTYSNKDDAYTQILFSTGFTTSFTLARATFLRIARWCDEKISEMNRFQWRQMQRQASYEARQAAVQGRSYDWLTLPTRAHYDYHHYSLTLLTLYSIEIFYFFFLRNLFIDFKSTTTFIGAELLRVTQDDLLRYWLPVLLADHANWIAQHYPRFDRVVIHSKLFQLVFGMQSCLPQPTSQEAKELEAQHEMEEDRKHASTCQECLKCIERTRSWNGSTPSAAFVFPDLPTTPATFTSPWLTSVDGRIFALALSEEVTWRYGIRSLVGLSSLFCFVCTLGVLKRGPNHWYYPDIGLLPETQFDQLMYFSFIAIGLETLNWWLMEWHRRVYMGKIKPLPGGSPAAIGPQSQSQVHSRSTKPAIEGQLTTSVLIRTDTIATSPCETPSSDTLSLTDTGSSSSSSSFSSVWSLTLRVLSYRSTLLLWLLVAITHTSMDVFLTRLDYN